MVKHLQKDFFSNDLKKVYLFLVEIEVSTILIDAEFCGIFKLIGKFSSAHSCLPTCFVFKLTSSAESTAIALVLLIKWIWILNMQNEYYSLNVLLNLTYWCDFRTKIHFLKDNCIIRNLSTSNLETSMDNLHKWITAQCVRQMKFHMYCCLCRMNYHNFNSMSSRKFKLLAEI